MKQAEGLVALGSLLVVLDIFEVVVVAAESSASLLADAVYTCAALISYSYSLLLLRLPAAVAQHTRWMGEELRLTTWDCDFPW